MKSKNKFSKDTDLAKVRELITQAFGLMNSDPSKCISISKEALQLSDKHQFGVGQGMAYMHIGLGYFHQSDYYNALKNYLKAKPFFKKENYWYGLRSIYNNIGIVYNQWDDLETALKYFHKNLELKSKFNDPKLSSTILNNIGGVYLQLKNYNKALEYYQESLQLSTEINFPYMISVAQDNIGKVLMHLNEKTKAEKFIVQAIELKESINDFAGLSNAYQNLALLKADADKNEEALTLLKKALHYSERVNEWKQVANIYQKCAYVYARMENTEQEKKYLDKCVAVSEPRNYRAILIEVYSRLANFFERKSQYKKALEYYKLIQKNKDLLSNEKKNRAIQEIKIRMEVERTEHEKKILQQKNDELKKMNAQILEQKTRLELVEKELKELNQNLEKKVMEETEKRRLQEQIVIQKSKLESLGQMAAGIAHEINQPIGLIKLATQNLFHKFRNKNITEKYLAEKSAFIDENITRINKIIEHIRLFSRDQKKESIQKIDVIEIMNNALSMVLTQFKNHNIKIVEEMETDLPQTVGNKYRLEQVILNLLSNARDALDEKYDELDDAKEIILRAYSKKKKMYIEVEDNGCGIENANLERAFDPFYTTKEESKGTGLGLSICYGIIQEMNGNISLESDKGKFTLIRIELPAYSSRK